MPENSQPVTKLQPRQALPIERVVPDVLKRVEHAPLSLLIAEPGAGKTTVLPLALANAPLFNNQKIIMLEPRRVAARSAAQYLAQQLGENLGQRIGYRIRGESRVSSHTQIEINTEGTLTRQLHEDQSLDGVGLIIFDEFHERSLHADLALALTLEVQRTIRPDLRILIMSATLDQQGLTRALGDLPSIHCEGRSFAVDIHFAEHDVVTPLPERVSDYVLRALKNHDGDILVFLPGRYEIQRAAEKLLARIDATRVSVICFHASSSPQEQRDALTADPHRRRVILATTIAETSLTVPGVRVVIDSGLVKVPMFDVSRGFTSLKTTRITQASATQRSGRAGRLGPGVCYKE
jgi:ATP-dependent helicase HrpB